MFLPNANKLSVVNKTLEHWKIKCQSYHNQEDFIVALSSIQAVDFMIFDEQVKFTLEQLPKLPSTHLICVTTDRSQIYDQESALPCHYIGYSITRNSLHQALLNQTQSTCIEKIFDTSIELNRSIDILIVDDVEVNLTVALSYLKEFKLSADTAVNGLEAVEKSSNKKYDIIFMDCQMPVLNGLDATLKIRQHELQYNKPRCPIIAMNNSHGILQKTSALISSPRTYLIMKPKSC